MTEPLRPSPPTSAPATSERREAPRRRHTVFKDVFFRGLRRMGGHAEHLYATVGIFLVVGAIVAVAGTLGFAAIGEYVREGATQRFDDSVLRWIATHHSRWLTIFMTEVTPLGTGAVVLMIVGVAAAFLWHTEHRHSARLLLAATAGSILLNNALKLYFQRDRPNIFEWQTHAASSSFPSGHAMSATVVYGTVAYLLARLQKRRWARALTLFLAVVMILLICFTRLYLGVHYPSDVIAGIIVGLAWSGFCMATLEASLVLARRRAPTLVEHEEKPTPVEQEIARQAPAGV